MKTLEAIIGAQRAAGVEVRESASTIVETHVYVGLNDEDTRHQEHGTARYISLLKEVCRQYGVPFSFQVINGGYIHDDGEYTEERSIMLTLVDVDQGMVDEMAKDLCAFFRQESVLVTTQSARARIVHNPRVSERLAG